MTGQAALTSLLMVIMVITGDYLSMAFATDRVQPSAAPNSWNIGKLTAAGVILGPGFLAFCARNPCRRKCKMHLDIGHLRTLCVVAIVFGG